MVSMCSAWVASVPNVARMLEVFKLQLCRFIHFGNLLSPHVAQWPYFHCLSARRTVEVGDCSWAVGVASYCSIADLGARQMASGKRSLMAQAPSYMYHLWSAKNKQKIILSSCTWLMTPVLQCVTVQFNNNDDDDDDDNGNFIIITIIIIIIIIFQNRWWKAQTSRYCGILPSRQIRNYRTINQTLWLSRRPAGHVLSLT